MDHRLSLAAEPLKLSVATYADDPLGTARADLLERNGLVRARTFLAPRAPVPRGTVAIVGMPGLAWYAQLIGFRNPSHRSFLLANEHLLRASLVIGVRDSRTRTACEKHQQTSAERAFLLIPEYLQKIGYGRRLAA